MAKLTPKHKPILRIILLSIAAIPVLFIIYIIVVTLLDPVFNNIDKAKFEKLDTQSRALYEQIKAVSGGADTWAYKASCEVGGSGGFQTYAQYNCETRISTVLPANSVDQLNALHAKYYPVFDGASMLTQKTQLDKEYPGEFGVKFVVSGAEKLYKTVSNNSIECTYLARLGDRGNSLYGTGLSIGDAFISISLRCTDHARGDWYN